MTFFIVIFKEPGVVFEENFSFTTLMKPNESVRFIK